MLSYGSGTLPTWQNCCSGLKCMTVPSVCVPLRFAMFTFFAILGALIPLYTDATLWSKCDRTKCFLPDCLCMSSTAPNGLDPQEIPQMVFLTFDDALTDRNYNIYDKILENRVNPNGCNISATFYVTHDWANLGPHYGTNYQLVNKYYNRGNEIASHSVTHTFDYEYWKNTTVAFWEREIGRQREIIHTYSNVPLDRIKGFRSPFLQTGGDATLSALQSLGMSFDSSLVTKNYSDPPMWPFTLDYGVPYDCVFPPCSTKKHPGLWNVPMINFKNGVNDSFCPMADDCYFADVATVTAKELFDYFLLNFERYKETRAPFGIHQHAVWFLGSNKAILEGFLQFLDYLGTIDYVYIVTVSQRLEWIKNPRKLNETDIFCCQDPINEAPCPEPQVCTYNGSVPGGARSMGSCTACPAEYPWLDNFERTQQSEETSTLIPSVVPSNPLTNNSANIHRGHHGLFIIATFIILLAASFIF